MALYLRKSTVDLGSRHPIGVSLRYIEHLFGAMLTVRAPKLAELDSAIALLVRS